MSSGKNIVGIRHKFATLRNQTIHIDINGFQLKTTIDKVDELFEYNVIRYCVNSVLYQLDRARQDAINYNMTEQMGFPCKFNNTANIPADMSGHSEPQKVSIVILVDEEVQGTLPDYCVKGMTGTSWDIHSNPEAPEFLDYINYVTGTIDKPEAEIISIH
jgi:hypothetical protein